MNAEYIKLSKHYVAQYGPNTAVLLQVGSFYELYDIRNRETGEGQTPMRRAVDILGIQLVEKKEGLEISAGFPDYALHKHASMLTRVGWTVAVIDQNKRGGKVHNRTVARILSPGTHVEMVTLDAVYLGGVWMEEAAWSANQATQPPAFGTAVFDFTTGDVKTYETVAVGTAEAWSADDLVHFFQVHPPRELIVWYRGPALTLPQEDTLRRALGLFSTTLHIRLAGKEEQGNFEKDYVRLELLREFFKTKSVLPQRVHLGLDDTPRTERVLVNLCKFIQDHYPSSADLSKIHQMYLPQRWIPRNSVFLGNHALTQLNMITPNNDGIVDLFLKTATGFGRRAMRERLLYPISDRAELSARYEAVAHFDKIPKEVCRRVEFLLKSLCDLPRTHRRLIAYGATVADILALDQTYTRAEELCRLLPSDLGKELADFHTEFQRVFDVKKGLTADEYTFCFQDSVAPKTAEVETKAHEIIKRTEEIADFLCKWAGLSSDALRVDAADGLEILINGTKPKTVLAAKLKDGLPPPKWKDLQVHVRRTEGEDTPPAAAVPFKTLHINVRKSMPSSVECDEIDSLRTLLEQQKQRFKRAVEEEMPVVCGKLLTPEAMTFLRRLESWLASVDISFTVNKVSSELGFCRPQLEPETVLESCVSVKHLRHPLIERAQSAVEYVTHSLDLEAGDSGRQGHLIYGVNASGKSSLMKSLGIAILLAQAGCYVPAREFRFAPFRKIFTRIQNNDNIWAGLSSFAVEMTELREILQIADAWTLVLGDEVCNGTESTSATALVGATLEYLHDVGAKFLFATHLHGLLQLPRVPTLPRLAIWHLLVQYDPVTQKLVYDRHLKEGPGNSLYGLEVARAMNLPTAVLERAMKLRTLYAGTSAVETAAETTWNQQLVRRKCGVCGNSFERDLEVHHIRQQKDAGEEGRFEDGTHKNHLSNLIVVCQKCHDDHHAGRITIGPPRQTSDGVEYSVTKSVATTEEVTADTTMETVESYLRKYPRLTPTRLQFELESQEGIKISVQKLGSIRKKMQA
jgi:DNA mismatch repair protein MutS